MDIDESIRESLAGFAAVWQRVAGAERPAGQAEETAPIPRFREEQAMESFIQAELCAAAFDKALARMFQSKGRAVLLAQAEDAMRRARRLRAEYFIRTGVTCTPENHGPSVGGKLASLREAMLREARLAQDYTQAAAQTTAPETQTLYAEYAAGSAARAQALRRLLVDCFF